MARKKSKGKSTKKTSVQGKTKYGAKLGTHIPLTGKGK